MPSRCRGGLLGEEPMQLSQVAAWSEMIVATMFGLLLSASLAGADPVTDAEVREIPDMPKPGYTNSLLLVTALNAKRSWCRMLLVCGRLFPSCTTMCLPMS